MNQLRKDPKPWRARFIVKHLEWLRGEEKVSVRELCRRTGKTAKFFADLAEGNEILTLADFIDICEALGWIASDVLDDIYREMPRPDA